MTYTTIQGDMWDSIAHKLYSNESYMVQLMQANPSHSRTLVFGAGVVLLLPTIETPVESDLPPWKKV